MTNVKSIVINMITLGILIFAIMSFTIITQSDNNIDDDFRLTNNTLINDTYGDLETSLDKQTDAQKSLNSTEKSPPSEYIGDLDVSAIISGTRTARSIITGLWNVYIKLPMVILGVNPVVASAISTILLIILVIGIWAIWKGAIT